MPTLNCPSPEELRRCALGGTETFEAERLFRHAQTCPSCRVALDALLRERDSSLGSTPNEAAPGAPPPDSAHAPAGEQQVTRAEDTVPPGSHGEDPAASLLPEVPGYAVLGELGRGGMGVVYKARHLALNRLVALKMVLASERAAPEQLLRLRLEAEMAARVQHPNVVQIYEVGTWCGQPFLAMEWVDGGSLAQRLNGGPLPPREAAHLTETLARAVQAAHAQGIIHRDLKPGNVLIASDDVPKVADFGLAKSVQGDPGLTETGAILGTPSYMAPEQAAGDEPVGAAADIWALGAILYEMLTGRPPFRAASRLETLQQVRAEDPVPPARLNRRVSRDLQTVCLKCLEKQPPRRYATALELGEELRRLRAGEPIQARPAGAAERVWRWACRRPAVAGLLAALFLVALTGLAAVGWQWREALWLRDRAADEAQQAEAARGKAARTAVKEAAARADAETARKQALADQREAEAQWARAEMAHYADLLSQAHKALKEGQLVRAQEFLRDCRWDLRRFEHRLLATMCQDRVRLLRGHKEMASAVAFSPDGTKLASVGRDQTVRLWDVSTGKELLQLPGTSGEPEALAFSPDGKYLAVGGKRFDWAGRRYDGGEFRVWETATGKEHWHHREPAAFVFGLAFSRDSQRLAFSTSPEPGKPGDVTLWDLGDLRQVASFKGQTQAVLSLDVSPDGKLLAGGGVDRTIRVWELTGGKVVHELRGHALEVRRVAFSPDGKRLASAGGNPNHFGRTSEMKVWDLSTGRPVVSVGPHEGWVHDVAFSPDGSRVLSGGYDGAVRLWDASTGRELLSLTGHEGAVYGVAFSPDGQTVASAGVDQIVRLWNLARGVRPFSPARDGKPVSAGSVSLDGRLAVVPCGDPPLPCVIDCASGRERWRLTGPQRPWGEYTFSPDGARVAGWGETRSGPYLKGKQVQVWDLDRGAKRFTLSVKEGEIGAVAFSGDGRWVVAGGAILDPRQSTTESAILTVWNLETGEAVHSLRPFRADILALACSPDGTTVAVGGGSVFDAVMGEPHPIQIRELKSGRLVRTLHGHTGGVRALAYSPDGKILASGGGDRVPRIWDVASGEELRVMRGHTAGIDTLCFSHEGDRLVSGGQDGTARIWEVRTGQELLVLPGPKGPVARVLFADEGGELVVGSFTGPAQVWRATPDPAPLVLTGHGFFITSLSFARDGRRMVSGAGSAPKARPDDDSIRGEVKVWDTVLGRELLSLRGLTGYVTAVAFRPDAGQFAAGNDENTIQLYDARTGQLQHTLRGHKSLLWSLAYSPDGKALASASWDGTVRTWDSETGKEHLAFEAHQPRVVAVAFSPDGKRLATAGGRLNERRDAWVGGEVKLWDAASGRLLLTLRGHRSTVTGVAFDADGGRLATSGGDGVVKVWDLAAERELQSFEGHRGVVNGVAFSPRGEFLASAGDDRTVRVWDLKAGREVCALKGHAGGVRAVAFTPDGRRLASGGMDQLILFWDLAAHVPSAPPRPPAARP